MTLEMAEQEHARRQRNDTAGDSGDEDEDGEADDNVEQATRRWRYCLHIAYLGTGFVGWQRQNEKSSFGMGSVQELVEDAITEILQAKERVNVTSVSRTDAGTHALYQYGTIRLALELPMSLEEFKDRVNAKLTDNVVVHQVSELNAVTKPTRIRSRYKKYIYYIQQGHRPDLELGKYSWFIGKKVDPQRLRDALSYLVGDHDFRPFSQGLQKAEFADKTTIRTLISAKVRVRRHVNFSLDPALCGMGELMDETEHLTLPDAFTKLPPSTNAAVAEANEKKKRRVERPSTPVHFICVELIANGFLRHMVRRIMGTLRPIGEGTYPPLRMKQVLNGEIEPGPSAPTKGLWLHRTWLTQEDWDADETRDD
uniref:tRNA pseudouridine synthase n=1 Tax=Globisporangium ultimum (strain ATCC 200006 / CBS 805.95 / DAOM BR144) TaxID=431595 RepID=K3W7Y4_GLOUD